ncbi:site-2 protease family protein, partial [Acinetobacter baumannii]
MLAYLQATAIVFNLIPIPGFDGWNAIEPYLPVTIRIAADRFRPITAVLVLVLIFSVPAVSMIIFRAAAFLTT